MIDCTFVEHWKAKYPLEYDKNYYEPYLSDAKKGDQSALRKLTEWKNVGKGQRPMKLWKTQEKAFNYFLINLFKYLAPDGAMQLRKDFAKRAPVWSIFWHHVLYSTPIFDVYTHMAYIWATTEKVLTKNDAKICIPGHWLIYDKYSAWFAETLKKINDTDPSLTDRDLDRALVCWGEAQHKMHKKDCKLGQCGC